MERAAHRIGLGFSNANCPGGRRCGAIRRGYNQPDLICSRGRIPVGGILFSAALTIVKGPFPRCNLCAASRRAGVGKLHGSICCDISTKARRHCGLNCWFFGRKRCGFLSRFGGHFLSGLWRSFFSWKCRFFGRERGYFFSRHKRDFGAPTRRTGGFSRAGICRIQHAVAVFIGIAGIAHRIIGVIGAGIAAVGNTIAVIVRAACCRSRFSRARVLIIRHAVGVLIVIAGIAYGIVRRIRAGIVFVGNAVAVIIGAARSRSGFRRTLILIIRHAVGVFVMVPGIAYPILRRNRPAHRAVGHAIAVIVWTAIRRTSFARTLILVIGHAIAVLVMVTRIAYAILR